MVIYGFPRVTKVAGGSRKVATVATSEILTGVGFTAKGSKVAYIFSKKRDRE